MTYYVSGHRPATGNVIFSNTQSMFSWKYTTTHDRSQADATANLQKYTILGSSHTVSCYSHKKMNVQRSFSLLLLLFLDFSIREKHNTAYRSAAMLVADVISAIFDF